MIGTFFIVHSPVAGFQTELTKQCQLSSSIFLKSER